MNWNYFRNALIDLACFTTHQVYAWDPGFDRNNFVRWTRKGYLLRLRRGMYAFADCKDDPEMALYFANKIYRPSYISLHSALSFYGLIPEAVVQITSVTPLKTAFFSNPFGEYSYRSVRKDLIFGYEPRQLANKRTIFHATIEKALLDLLYLYPFYRTEKDLADLRLDQNILHQDVDLDRWDSYCGLFRSAALRRRAKLLRKVYEL